MNSKSDDRVMVFDMLTVCNEGAVLFAEIKAPPMNLLGPELVRDMVSLIQRAEAGDVRNEIVGIEGMRTPEAQKRTQAAIEHGFQTREAEMSLGRLLGNLTDR